MNWIDIFECVGSLNGIAGAWVLALKCRYSKFGWLAYLASNIFMIAFAIALQRNWLLLQFCAFTLSSLVGIWNYIVCDKYPLLPMFSVQSIGTMFGARVISGK